MLSGAADVCLVQGETQGAGLTGRLLGRDAVFPVVAPSRRADAARFPEMDLIENTEHSWADWHAHWRTPFSVRTPQLTTGDWVMALEGARAGLGVALTCRSLAAEDLASGRLLRVGVQEMPCRAGCYAFWRPTSAKRDPILALLDDWDLAAPSDPLDEQAARGLLHARV